MTGEAGQVRPPLVAGRRSLDAVVGAEVLGAEIVAHDGSREMVPGKRNYRVAESLVAVAAAPRSPVRGMIARGAP